MSYMKTIMLLYIFSSSFIALSDKNITVEWLKSPDGKLIIFNAYEGAKIRSENDIAALLIEVDPEKHPVLGYKPLKIALGESGKETYAGKEAKDFISKIGLLDNETMLQFRRKVLGELGPDKRDTHIWPEQWKKIIEKVTNVNESILIGKNKVTFKRIQNESYSRFKKRIDGFFAIGNRRNQNFNANPIFPHLLEIMQSRQQQSKTRQTPSTPQKDRESDVKTANDLTMLYLFGLVVLLLNILVLALFYQKIGKFGYLADSASHKSEKSEIKGLAKYFDKLVRKETAEIIESIRSKEDLKQLRELMEKNCAVTLKQKDDLIDAIRATSDQTVVLESINNLFNKYKSKVTHFEEEGHENDKRRLADAQNKYRRWKECLITLMTTFDNELYFSFLKIIENKDFKITKDNRIMTFPIDSENHDKLRSLNDKLGKIDKQDLMQQIDLISEVNVRKTTDFDYRIEESEVPEELRNFLKRQLSTILLILKKLDKFRNDMINLSTKALENQEKVFKPLQTMDTASFIDHLLDNKLSEEEKSKRIEQILKGVDEQLKSNFQIASQAKDFAEEFEKGYFHLLSNKLFKIVSDLHEAAKNYKKDSLEFSEYSRLLEEWGKIYSRLISLFNDYLKTKLHTEAIECKPGDPYNEDVHNPYDEAQPAQGLADNSIKEIVNPGFQFDDTEKKVVIKPVDVIVVKNN